MKRSLLHIFHQIFLQISFYPIIGILIGGAIVNLQNSSALIIPLTWYCLAVSIATPLWFLGQHWVFLFFPSAPLIGVEQIEHLLGLHIILGSLLLLGLLLCLRLPPLAFAFYFWGRHEKDPLKKSQEFSKGRFFGILMRLGFIAFIGIATTPLLLLCANVLLKQFTVIYSGTYIYWANILRPSITILGSAITTTFSMWYLYKYWLTAKNS